MKKKMVKIILIVTIFFSACQDTSNKQEKLPVSATPQVTEENTGKEPTILAQTEAQSTIPQTEATTVPQTETEQITVIPQIETTTVENQTNTDNYVTFF